MLDRERNNYLLKELATPRWSVSWRKKASKQYSSYADISHSMRLCNLLQNLPWSIWGISHYVNSSHKTWKRRLATANCDSGLGGGGIQLPQQTNSCRWWWKVDANMQMMSVSITNNIFNNSDGPLSHNCCSMYGKD